MSNYNLVRTGSRANTSFPAAPGGHALTLRENFLIGFSHEITASWMRSGYSKDFVEKSYMSGSHVGGGNVKAIEIPRVRDLFPEWHEPGTEMEGKNAVIEVARITADQVLVLPLAVSLEDNVMAAYLRGDKNSLPVQLATLAGQGFAAREDVQVGIQMVRAARGYSEAGSANFSNPDWHGRSGYGGTALAQTPAGRAQNDCYDPLLKLPDNFDADDFLEVLTHALTQIDKRRLSGQTNANGGAKNGWYLLLSPHIWWMLFKEKFIMNKDYAGEGSIATGYMPRYAGLQIINYPAFVGARELGVNQYIPGVAGGELTYDDTPNIHMSGTAAEHKYWVENPQMTAAMLYHSSCLRRLVVLDVVTEQEWDIRRLSTFGVTYAFMGGGIVQPEGAIEICYKQAPQPDGSAAVDGYN